MQYSVTAEALFDPAATIFYSAVFNNM